MKQIPRLALATEFMSEFADQTGISSAGEAERRYLWTDAFALCNFLELYRQTGDEGFKELALLLVDQVHGILGRHRKDDPRTGWISGLDELEGRLHPTMGGLRIGKGKDWTTEDPLGIGGLFSDAYRAAQIKTSGAFQRDDLLASLLDACRRGLDLYARTGSLKAPADHRLAFRELGLSIGLRALERLERLIESGHGIFKKQLSLQRQVKDLRGYLPWIEIIENFWLEPANRKAGSYTEHIDINRIMLATSLISEGYLTI